VPGIASTDGQVNGYTDNRFRPFALRRLMTLRPCLVDIRFKNPWVLERFLLLG